MSDEQKNKANGENPTKPDYLEVIGNVAPGIALLAGLLYVFGLYSAYRMDSSLGVGTIEVSRERAVCLGFINLVLIAPSAVFWSNIRENMVALSTKSYFERLKVTLWNAIVPSVLAFMLVFLASTILGIEQNHLLATAVYLPIALMVIFLFTSSSFSRQIVTGWLWFLLITLSALASLTGLWLPSEFGGHAGKRLIIIMKDGTIYQGTHRVSDSKIIVLSTSNTNQAISRDGILSIESRRN